ncbi:MAG: proline dehydrogenase family protein [Propionibacteriaceae bacterium]|jgi:proline dehydrogenase|nr:proline dehydrogenase family protein [Propionibacteriaceae bacterium]
MYRKILLGLSRNAGFHKILGSFPPAASVVRRFVAGKSWEESRAGIAALTERGLKVSLDYLGGDVDDTDEADAIVAANIDVLDHIDQEQWADVAELSLNLTSVGLWLPGGEQVAIDNALRICERAQQLGTTVTIGMEDFTTTEETIRVAKALRAQYPWVGVTLQSSLKRSESDCAALSTPGARTRLVKGAYDSPVAVAYQRKHDINLNYVRCLKTLMEGQGFPLVATHDPVMIEIAQELVAHTNRGLSDFEFQMLYGIRTNEQERLAELGHTVRVCVPFGPGWYDYCAQRMAARPGNLTFVARSFLPGK